MTNYEALLKEQVMQHILGNDARSLKNAAECLILDNKQDQQQIMFALEKVNDEIFGDLI